MSASSAKYPIRWAFSAGGIVYRRQGLGLQVVLIRVRDAWTLPKGAIEKGEKSHSAALREVQEETGLEVEPQGKLGEIAYWFVNPQERVRTHKKVTFFLFEGTLQRYHRPRSGGGRGPFLAGCRSAQGSQLPQGSGDPGKSAASIDRNETDLDQTQPFLRFRRGASFGIPAPQPEDLLHLPLEEIAGDRFALHQTSEAFLGEETRRQGVIGV